MADTDGAALATLTIDLAAIAENYRLLAGRSRPAECAGVVKADAYGLGAAMVAPTLWAAGCRTFFVATFDEGVALRRILPQARIYVLGGLQAPDPQTYVLHGLRPSLTSLSEIERWRTSAAGRTDMAAGLHVDTGMARLGLPADELATLVREPHRLTGLTIDLVMSHLACADEPDHPLNREQLHRFQSAIARLPLSAGVTRSFANSSGVFLGSQFAFSLVRPGAALYGVAPLTNQPNPMRQVVRLQARILQVRCVDAGTSVGYGATHRFARPARLATVGVGYADGYLRSLSNRGGAYVGDRRVPIVGRVSMDLTVFDVTEIPEAAAQPGTWIDLIGPHNPVDAVATEAGTIGYEILTSLGRRYQRRYLPADGNSAR